MPRDESFREDVEAAEAAAMPTARRLYRDFRAAAESGWDFSSRWFADGESIATTRTTSIVPVDLNSLLYGLEQAIAEGCRETGDSDCARRYETLAAERRSAMHRYLWNEATGVYDDWLWTERRRLGNVTAATLYPLFAGLATDEQAHALRRSSARNCSRTAGWSARTATPASSGMRRTAGRPCNGSP